MLSVTSLVSRGERVVSVSASESVVRGFEYQLCHLTGSKQPRVSYSIAFTQVNSALHPFIVDKLAPASALNLKSSVRKQGTFGRTTKRLQLKANLP